MISQLKAAYGAKVRDVCVDGATGVVVVVLDYGWKGNADGAPQHWIKLHMLDAENGVAEKMEKLIACSCVECRIGSKG